MGETGRQPWRPVTIQVPMTARVPVLGKGREGKEGEVGKKLDANPGAQGRSGASRETPSPGARRMGPVPQDWRQHGRPRAVRVRQEGKGNDRKGRARN